MSRLESPNHHRYGRRYVLALCGALLALVPDEANAFSTNYLPLNAQELSRRFPMKQLQADCVNGRLGSVGPHGAQLTLQGKTAQLVGRDHAGGRWL